MGWIVIGAFFIVIAFAAVVLGIEQHQAILTALQRHLHQRAVKVAERVGTEVAVREPEPVYETYGHPWAPLPELKAKLPPPPANHSWEIAVGINTHNSPALRLSLLDLRTTETSDFIERDLVVIRRWRYADNDTFASFYRRAGDEVRCRKVFYAHLLAPMADWAKTVAVTKSVVEPPALTTSYLLVEGAAA